MKTVITINHASRADLKHALTLIGTELSQGYLQSSGRVPAKEGPYGLINMTAPVYMPPEQPGFPSQPRPAELYSGSGRRRDDEKTEKELPPTSYTYEVVE